MSYPDYYENRNAPVKDKSVGFHLHRYGRWEKVWEYSILQQRSCVKCGKTRTRFIS